MAYGEAGQGSNPPKSELIFDVELLGVADVPPAPAGADILLSFSDSESKVIALAKVVPEEKYSWRPAPGVRFFGEVFVHIVSANQLLMKLATSTPSADELKTAFEEQSKLEKQTLSKDRIIQMLIESFAAVRQSLESARPVTLAREANFFARPPTRRLGASSNGWQPAVTGHQSPGHTASPSAFAILLQHVDTPRHQQLRLIGRCVSRCEKLSYL